MKKLIFKKVELQFIGIQDFIFLTILFSEKKTIQMSKISFIYSSKFRLTMLRVGV